jgi:hypothetical protein
MDMDKLIAAMPGIAEKLGVMMATEALPMLISTGLSLETASPSVSISFATKDENIKVTLSIGDDADT